VKFDFLFPLLRCAAPAAALALLVAAFEAQTLRDQVLAQLDGLRFGKMKEQIARIAEASAAAGASATLAPVSADHEGGFIDGPLRVTLQDPNGGIIHYTVDGSVPNARSAVYNGPIHIERSQVLSFRTFVAHRLPGPVESRTFIRRPDYRLPVLSLTIDPVFLNSRHSGIYVYPLETGRKWRRPAQIEYFERDNGFGLRFPVELRIHGNWTRDLQKKSFQINFAPGDLQGQDSAGILKPTQGGDGQSSVILRAAAMEASYRLGDELFRSLYAAAGGLVSRASLAMLLINGQPWGLYNLHEKIDQQFLERRYGAGAYDLVKYERYVEPVAGTVRDWNELLEFFARHDFTSDDALHRAAQRIDIDNFTDFSLFNIYAANLDWPHNNSYAFRKAEGDGRWRWISWDADLTFDSDRGLNHDTLTWASRHELRPDLSYAGTKGDAEEFLITTLILRSLLQNRSYRARFVNRFCGLMSSHFSSTGVRARFDEIVEGFTPHLGVDWERWPGSRENYEKAVHGIHRFIDERPAILLGYFQERFGFDACRPGASARRAALATARP